MKPSLLLILPVLAAVFPAWCLGQDSAAGEPVVVEENGVTPADDDSAAVPAAPAASPAAPDPAAVPVMKKDGLILDMEDGTILLEEGEEDIFEDEEPPSAPDAVTPPPARSVTADTVAPAQQQPVQGEPAEPGRAPAPPYGKDRYMGRRGRPSQAEPQDPAVVVPTGPARVEDVRSINFARNLQEYRSPKLAMFLSLLVPGLGQAYARNYWKTAVFGVIEAGIIGVSIGYNVKGDSELEKARDFAGDHFDAGKFTQYFTELRDYLVEIYASKATNPDSAADQRLQDIYFTPEGDTFLTEFNRDAAKANDEYFSLMSEKSFVQGWDDCEPTLAQIRDEGAGGTVNGAYGSYQVHVVPDSAYLVGVSGYTASDRPIYGYSPNQVRYGELVSTANDTYRTGTNVLFLLLVNHIGSAIDAAITAKQHNDRLLNRQTFWDRIDIEQRWVFTGSEIAPGCALSVRF